MEKMLNKLIETKTYLQQEQELKTIWEKLFEKTILLIFILLFILFAVLIIEDVFADIGGI